MLDDPSQLRALRQRAREILSNAVEKAKRTNVAFPEHFAVSATGQPPPLARMIQGGRGGEIRLKVYLCITMLATRAPFDIRQPPTPQGWTRMLGMPADTGPRRVSTALKWLSDNRFIALKRRSGAPAAITLLNPGGNGGPYQRPRLDGQFHYIGVPAGFWANGWIVELSATGVALLLVLLEHQWGKPEARYVSREKKESFGLSQDTWTRARKELELHELIQVSRVPQGSDFDYKRMRNAYRVNRSRLDSPP